MSDADRRRRFVDYFSGAPLRGDRAKLIQLTGMSKGRISQFFDATQPFGEKAARRLAEKLDLDGDFFLSDGTPMIANGQVRHKRDSPLAHQLIHPAPILDVTRIEWGSLMKDLPAAFALVVRDNAIDAWASKGQVGRFRPVRENEKIAPGTRVLVLDKLENAYLRVYRERTPTHWQAVATNANYDPLDSIEHGLRVIAVMTGVDWE